MIFHPFHHTSENVPARMNNPLDYEPHPLCIQACREVQEMLAKREDWQEEIARGKMFGVLIVENVKTDTDVPKWGYPAADSEAPNGDTWQPTADRLAEEATGRTSCLPYSTICSPTATSRPTRQRSPVSTRASATWRRMKG